MEKEFVVYGKKKFNQRNSEKLKTEKDGVNLKLDYGLLR